jgi:hypothetical protein
MVIVKQHKGNSGNDTSHSRGSSKHTSGSASNTKSPSITPSLPPSNASSSASSSTTLLDTNTTTVKVKDVLRKTETEVPRSELCMWLASEMAEQARVDHSYTMTSKRNKYDFKSKDSHHHHHHHHGSDPSHLDMDTSEGQEKKPTNLDVQVVYAEERGKARTKMKQKRKDVLIDKGKKTRSAHKSEVLTLLFFFFSSYPSSLTDH